MSVLFFLQENMGLTLVLAGILGLCVGSFLNVVIYRTPLIMRQEWRRETAEFWQEEPDLADIHKQALRQTVASDPKTTLSFPPSTCPKCHHGIRWFENIPVVSWIFLRGRCSNCQNPISARYPFVELATALLSLLVVYHFGASIQAALALVFTWILVALTGIDLDTQLLPDRLVYPLGMLGLLANAFAIFALPTSAMLGGVLGFLVFYIIAQIFMWLTRKEGMGFGDFKLLAAIGAWVGAEYLLLIVFLSAIVGAVVGGLTVRFTRDKPFAFGPYIALSGFVALLWGRDILTWYLG